AVAVEPDVAAAVRAQRLELRETEAAVAAVEIEIGGDRVARLEARDARASRDDLARDLVPDDARGRDGAASRLDGLDGEPGAAGDDPRHRFTGARDRIGQFHRLERKLRPAQQHRFHESKSPSDFAQARLRPRRALSYIAGGGPNTWPIQFAS